MSVPDHELEQPDLHCPFCDYCEEQHFYDEVCIQLMADEADQKYDRLRGN